jgi:hypothetical protein
MVRSGKYRAEKVRYPDGVGCCFWKLFKDGSEDEDGGLCFDFPIEDLADLKVIVTLLGVEPERVYVPDPEYEKFEEKRKEAEKTWWWKLHHAIEDIGVQVVPFDWRFRRFLVTRPSTMKNGALVYKSCKGFHYGPVVVTW